MDQNRQKLEEVAQLAGVKGRSGGHNRLPVEELHRRGTFNVTRHRSRPVLAPLSVGAIPVAARNVLVEPPDDLPSDARAVWLRLAPHAVAARTLTPASALAFALLCRNVALELALSASVADRGGSNHRGMIQRVDAELLRFNLAPGGTAIDEAEPEAKPVNPLEKFLKRG